MGKMYIGYVLHKYVPTCSLRLSVIWVFTAKLVLEKYLGGTGLDRLLGYQLPTKDIRGFNGVCSHEYQNSIHLKMSTHYQWEYVTILFLKRNYKGKCDDVTFKAMKAYWRSRGNLRSFFMLVRDRGKRLTSRPDVLPLGERAKPTEEEAGWAPELVWSILEKRVYCSCRDSNPGPASP